MGGGVDAKQRSGSRDTPVTPVTRQGAGSTLPGRMLPAHTARTRYGHTPSGNAPYVWQIANG